MVVILKTLFLFDTMRKIVLYLTIIKGEEGL